ncbi:hypothetical protein F5B21DRAFT_518147 [Xylaria acuta]|nr:hypothetical protein F5B21DRAFT_518147 [Xylaria acuta]
MTYCKKCKQKHDSEQMIKCCGGTYYCDKMCEKADYEKHKKSCTKLVVFALIKDIYDPFNRLKRGDYLQGRPDIDVYKTLIDAYRLRMDDNALVEVRHEDSIYGKSKDGLAGFHQFLDRARAIPRMMPSWWDDKKQAECEELGRQTGWSSLTATIKELDVCNHYNPLKHYTARKHFTDVARKYYKDVAREDHYDIYIDVQLRLLAEDIYGTSIDHELKKPRSQWFGGIYGHE